MIRRKVDMENWKRADTQVGVGIRREQGECGG